MTVKTLHAPLMPKSTATWLIDNTSLNWQQIADFCGISAFEIEALADGDAGKFMPENPIDKGYTTRADIDRAQADPNAALPFRLSGESATLVTRTKGPRYTPVAKRADKPNAIAWLLKHHPELTDNAIIKIVGTTRNTIQSLRDKTYAGMSTLQPRSPIDLGLVSYDDFNKTVEKTRKQLEKEGKWSPDMDKSKEALPEEEDTARFDFSNFLGARG